MPAFAPLILLLVVDVCVASENKPTPFQLDELPEPPPQLLELIESGRVTFVAGPREVAQPRNSPRIVAETHFKIAYNYAVRSQWKLDRKNGNVVIKVRYSRIEWDPKHEIWFLDRPATQDFWSNRLVLHEFDHVRISNDPRLKTRFEQLLREQTSLTRSIDDGVVVNRAYVNELIDDHVSSVFAEITDLVSIRYKELDRVTGHGVRPLPSDSTLNELLRPDSTTSP